MIYFTSDYTEGAHPAVLKALEETNMEQTTGYQEDVYCNKARALLKERLNSPSNAIHFFAGGTLANLTFITHALKPYQAVISYDTGHIAVHETGAIEARGHKVIIRPNQKGKLTPEAILSVLQEHGNDHHMVQPKMVYISHPTELGTLYTLEELKTLKALCDQYNLIFYMDGARFAQGIAAHDNSLTWQDLPKLFDAFYIGATKCGGLFGEALIIENQNLAQDFLYTLKQCGGLMAKGRILGLQFVALLEEELYEDLGAHAIKKAQELHRIFREYDIEFLVPTVTNQLFPILENDLATTLSKTFAFQKWEDHSPTHTVYRFVTSWATPENHIEALAKTLEAIFCP